MDVGCSLWDFGGPTNRQNNEKKIHQNALQQVKFPPSEAYQCKGAPTCPSTAYQGPKTLCIYNMDVGCSLWGFGGLTNSQSNKKTHQNAIQLGKCPPREVYQPKGGPTCPSTAYQSAKILCVYKLLRIYNMDERCTLWGFGGHINRQYSKKIHQNCILASKKRKKTQKYTFQTGQNNFFQHLS